MGRAIWIGPASRKLPRARPGCRLRFKKMNLRPALTEDLLFILALEQKFREMRLLGGSDPAVHQRQLSNPDCLYWIVEAESGPAGFVILRDIHSKDRNVELQRIAVAEPGRGLGSGG